MTSTAVQTEELIRQVAWVRALARQLVADEHGAEDLAQEAMVAALSQPPRAGANLRHWLAVVVRNGARLSRRGHVRRERRERQAAATEALPSAAELASRFSMHRRLADEVQALSEPSRTTVLLRFFEERSLREIATHFDVPVSTVNSRLRRAIQTLRLRLDERHDGRRAWVTALAPLCSTEPTAPTSWLLSKMAVIVLAASTLAGGLVWRHHSTPPATDVAGDMARRSGGSTPEAQSPTTTHQRSTTRALVPSGAAAATVAIPGVVVDVTGTPLAGVEVGLVPLEPEDNFPRARVATGTGVAGARPDQRPFLAATHTRSDGRFELAAAAPNGRIVVRDDAWTTVLAGVSWDSITADRVVVVAPTMPLTGIVIAPRGRACAGAKVTLEMPAELRSRLVMPLDHSVMVGWTAVVDDAGRFELRHAPQVIGTEVVVRAPGCRELRRSLTAAMHDGEYRLEANVRGAFGTVVDPHGAPIAGATVSLDARVVTETDVAGRYSFREPAQGAPITAVAPGFAPAVGVAGRAEEPLVLTMRDPAASIAGRVVDPRGNPVPGAWVWFTNPTVLNAQESDPVLAETVLAGRDATWSIDTTDAEGRFELLCLDRTDYELRANRPGSSRFGELGPVAAGRTADIVYPADTVVPSIAGRVVDLGRVPIARALVTATRTALRIPVGSRFASWQANGPSSYTDAEGRFELREVPREAGLHVNLPGFMPLRVAPESWQGTTHQELRLARACHVRVTAPEPGLSFAALNDQGVELEILLPQGIGIRPMRRCELQNGESPVVTVPEMTQWIALHRGDQELDRREVTVGAELVHVRF
ncbi:MAG: sigma-70 family RNA polymerase sigma factor [Planctomycetota bacterium]